MKFTGKVRGYSIFWAQIILVFACLFMGFFIGAQLFAYLTGLGPVDLGDPYYQLGSFVVYEPWMLFKWAIIYGEYYTDEFLYACIAPVGGIFGAIFTSAWLSVVRHREDGEADSHGDSRWATDKETKQSELVIDESKLKSIRQQVKEQAIKEMMHQIVLGKMDDGTLLRHTGPQHAGVIAPTRSKKGVGIINPTLLSWMGSVLVTDIKKENWFTTSGWRSQFSHCICFDPTDLGGACWNPLLEIRKGEQYEVRDAQNIAITLIDPDGEKQRSDHWDKAGYDFLTGAILHVLYAESNKTLNGVVNFMSDPTRDIYRTLTVMMKTLHLKDKPHPVIASVARSMLNKSPNELSGVQSTVLGYLSLYRDPVVAKVTSKCDFKIFDLVEADKPVSLYIVVPPSDITRTAPLVRLMLNMVGSKLASTPLRPGVDNTPYKHKLLLLKDELPAFGYMQFFEKALGYCAGYGIRALIIAQSLQQIESVYGPKNALLQSCHIMVFYAPNPQDIDGAEKISKMLGDTTMEKRNSMFSGGRLAFWLRNVTVSAQEMGRKLLTPGEIQRLPDDKLIILTAGIFPVMANKITYYEDPLFKPRMLPDIPTDGTYTDYPQTKPDEWADCIVAPPPEEEPDNAAPTAPVTVVLAAQSKTDHTQERADTSGPQQTTEPADHQLLTPLQQQQILQSEKRVEEHHHHKHAHDHDKDHPSRKLDGGDISW